MTVTPARTRKRFDWKAVDARLIRRMLESLGEYEPARLRGLSDVNLRRQAAIVFGDPPAAGKLVRPTLEVLRDRWLLQAAGVDDVRWLVSHLAPGTANSDRIDVAFASKTAMLSYLGRRRFTATYQQLIHQAFVRAHKTPQPVLGAGRVGTRQAVDDAITLGGTGKANVAKPYPHQIEALKKLDKLLTASSSEARGLLVLPTGGGKTRTVAQWLMQQLAKDSTLRVLWLAHQQELLEQAAATFEQLAPLLARSGERRARLVSSNHASTSVFVDDHLDIVFATWQSLHRNWTVRDARRVATFMRRPTLVVVDEAHRAGAAGYDQILTALQRANPRAVIGLTATPWPGSPSGTRRFRETFPREIYRISPEELHARGVLATPVLHTLDTGVHLELSANERKLVGDDLPPSVLRKLATRERDRIVVNQWTQRPTFWGKTLAFATSKAHAEQLRSMFDEAGVPAQAVYTGAPGERGEMLRWFRAQKTPCVLVSVGMLTEGVDLPDARTAILARPTTSRILLRQMIGRVLRGPQAGGEPTAHLLFLRDHWLNFEDVLDPLDLPDLAGRAMSSAGGTEHELPPLVDELTETELPRDLERQLGRMYEQRVASLPHDHTAGSAHLIGYYDLGDLLKVPVLSHQEAGFAELIARAAARGHSFQGAPPRSLFDDVPPPYPSKRSLDLLVDYVRTSGEPEFVEVSLRSGAEQVALDLLRDPGLDTGDWLQQQFEAGLARLAYRSLDHFREDVYRLVNEHRSSTHARHNPESLPIRAVSARSRAPRHSTHRVLPRIQDVARQAAECLEGEAVLEHLYLDHLPPCTWTERSNVSFWATWTLKTSGKAAGKPYIRVNKALQVSATHVPDAVLEYLLFHELLHHLLPAQGHSAEFRRLEGMWPDADRLDHTLDELHKTLNLTTGRR